LQRA